MPVVRRADLNDASLVARLVDSLLVELSGSSSRYEERLATAYRLLTNGDRIFGFFAVEKQHPLGVIMISERASIYAAGSFGVITELYVVPEKLRPPRSCRSKDQTARQGAGYPRHLLIAQAEPNVGSVTSKRLAGLAAGATWPRNLFGAGLLRSIRDRPCWTSARSCLSVEKRSGLNLDTPNQVIGQRAPGGVGNVRRIDHSPFY